MSTARFAESYCRRYGLSLVPLPPRSKRPLADDWGKHVIADPAAAAAYYDEHPDWNIGVALGPSRLCSFDVDDIEATRLIFEEFGWDLDALRSHPTIQGSPDGFRVMFRVPDGVELQFGKLTWPRKDDPQRFSVVLELRASTGQQLQDVLPPSIHPDTGKPYVWLTRPNGSFPEPPEWLLKLWQNWAALKPQLQAVCPWAPKPAKPRRAAPAAGGGVSVIDAYDQAHDLELHLERYGYKRQGKRWLSPHSGTGLPGVTILDDSRCWIHHASDPLCSDESGQPVAPFDLFRFYEHGGDIKKATRAAAEILGLERHRPEPAKPVPAAGAAAGVQQAAGAAPPGAPANRDTGALELAVDGKGKPLNNLDNVVRAIALYTDLRGQIWYDEFLDAIVTTWQGPERQWTDADDVKLQLFMQRHVGLTRVGVQTCHDAALVSAFHDVRNECRSWLESHVWDEVDRLRYLMTEGFGAEETDYTAAVGRCWITSMVARVFEPGCKVDTVPVLEGSQGVGKSTSLRILGGKWFTECHESVLTKDFYGVLNGHMLVEISEMHSFTRAEVERVKGIISCQIDRFRKAYGRNTENHPRQTVLACTTNRDDWQRDDTGARRFWPVRCGTVNHQWLAANRDQLFAEAVHRFRAGESWWDVPVLAQQEAAEARRDADSWEGPVSAWLASQTRPTTTEILRDCIGLEVGRHDQLVQKRVARVMRVLGWSQIVMKADSGRSYRAWVRDV